AGKHEMNVTLLDEVLDGSSCGASLHVVLWVPTAAFLEVVDSIVDGHQEVSFSCGGWPIVIAPKRRLVIVGATHLAHELTRACKAADFFVIVVDPRRDFATDARNPFADQLIIDWPDDALGALLPHCEACVILAHDGKIEIPALVRALRSTVPYIGVLGSKRSQRARLVELGKRGFTTEDFKRLHGPAGLDIGGLDAGQIACSILAEVLCVLNGRNGRPLTSNS
ncbi:MAG: XdhC family protein, partial [Vulcanimicrobiaceae bacterium]